MNKYMEVAKNLSEDNLKTKKGGPFGACIVKDDKIIGRGSNNVLINNVTPPITSNFNANDYIENNPDFSSENYTDYQEMVYYMFSKIKNKKIEFEGKMLGNDKEERHVKYTYEDANKFTIRLTEKRYVTKEKVLHQFDSVYSFLQNP